ncbi:MAG TPA: BON domain-containing protein [Polyangia bacterium]
MTATKRKPDLDIQQDVARELAWDTRVSPTEVGIAVKGGVVTLSGAVDSWAKLRSAEAAAHRVSGVLDVANELVVELPGDSHRSDGQIAQAVRQALEMDITVPDRQIHSTVSRGVVTLTGVVSCWSARADAERAIDHLAGVKRVINHLEIEPKPVDVAEAHQAIERALESHADREAAHIRLKVVDGTVKVSGVAHSWQERDAILGAVRGTRGVGQVVNDLIVQISD